MPDPILRPPDKPRRFRDPVYDLYTFRDGIDGAALQLIETRAFQRLRRIKQLGFADHVYPSASHSRFAHSLGVFAGARMLIRGMRGKNPENGELFDDYDEEIACFAALLHDVGHGPLSHVFEKIHERAFGTKVPHEHWTEQIVTGDSEIAGILGGHAGDVANLLRGRRLNCWSGIVSSALDADRLDYVRRDRLMSGTGTGAIDFTWLLEHARLRSGPIPGIAGLENTDVRTFAVDRRAVQQAEIFLLARYHLYDQVYFHKVCRAFECMLIACLGRTAELVREEKWESAGLSETNAFVQFLRRPELEEYLSLDDAVLSATIQTIARSASTEKKLRQLASWIVNRKMPFSIELEKLAPQPEAYERVRNEALGYVQDALGLERDFDFFFDEPELSIYGKGEAGSTGLHKKLWIDTGDGQVAEITSLSNLVTGHPASRRLGRLFFPVKAHRDSVVTHLGSRVESVGNAQAGLSAR